VAVALNYALNCALNYAVRDASFISLPRSL